MRNSTATLATCAALLGAGLVISPGADAKGPPGPKFSIDVQAFCGDPYAIDPLTLLPFGYTNVAVWLENVSDDNGPAGAYIGNLTVECTHAVKYGPGQPTHERFAIAMISMDDPGFGLVEVSCPVGLLPEGATEWKATATASGGDVRRPKSDTCEEVPVPDAESITVEPVTAEETVTEVSVTETPVQ